MRQFFALLVALAGTALAAAMLMQVRWGSPPAPAPSVRAAPAPSAPVSAVPAAILATPPPIPAERGPEGRFWARGVIEPAEGLVRVAAPSAGIVAQVAVKAGDSVQAGDLLAQLDDRDARAAADQSQAQLAAQTARVKAAEAARTDRAEQLARVERLRADRAASDEEVQRGRLGLRTAEAAAAQALAEEAAAGSQAARAVLAVELLAVRAPSAGLVVRVEARPGEAARPEGAPLALLAGSGALGVRGELEPGRFPRLQPGAAAVARSTDPAGREAAWPLRLERLDPPLRAGGPEGVWLAFDGTFPAEARAGLSVEVWGRAEGEK